MTTKRFFWDSKLADRIETWLGDFYNWFTTKRYCDPTWEEQWKTETPQRIGIVDEEFRDYTANDILETPLPKKKKSKAKKQKKNANV